MLEEDFWPVVRKGFGPRWRYRRIEDKLSLGVPDVFFTLSTSSGRMAGMMELKCQDFNKSGNIRAPHYTQEQRDFAMLHEAVFLLLYCSGWVMLFDHSVANVVLRGQSFEQHKKLSVYVSQSPDFGMITDIIRRSLLSLAQH